MIKKRNLKTAIKSFAVILFVGLMLSSFAIKRSSIVLAQEVTTEAPTEISITRIPPTPTGEVSGQIVGGTPADPGEWPWQVALIGGTAINLWYGQFCGGSLVNPEWVVTAAHCVYGKTPPQVDVVAGIYDLWDPASGYQRRDVSQIVVHPSYNFNTLDFDIALLRLVGPIMIGGSGETKTSLVPLISPSIGDLVGFDAWVTGWGSLSYGGYFPYQLYEVQVPIISNALCNDVDHYNGVITENMICAGILAGGKDACEGDSGGPLLVQTDGEWQLAGIVSWGNGCAEPQYPGVYTRVSNFSEWVISYTGTFADVSADYWAWQYIESIYNAGITGGCGTSPLIYCPNTSVTRAQMAVFLEKGIHGSVYNPPVVPITFNDTSGHWAQYWIEALKSDGITAGCGGDNYCPNTSVTRAQMAVFLLRSKYGSAYSPPAVGASTGFNDVPTVHWAAAWIKQLAAEGITGGCGGGNYCPDSSVNRAQMAVFLQKTFNLPLP